MMSFTGFSGRILGCGVGSHTFLGGSVVTQPDNTTVAKPVVTNFKYVLFMLSIVATECSPFNYIEKKTVPA